MLTTQDNDYTTGHLLDGRVRYAQPRHGFRSGIEPVLLAAAIPARPGARVLEGGTGAGAALLCLASRIFGLRGAGIEQDPVLVALARQNAAANGWPDLRFCACDVADLPELGEFDHACANPPYHAGSGTASPDPSRQVAKHGDAALLRGWATALTRPLRPRGTLTFILAVTRLPEALAAFAEAGSAPASVLPLWPKAGRPARLVLLRGIKRSRGPFRMLPGLVLHQQDGSFTAAAEAVLRGGAALHL